MAYALVARLLEHRLTRANLILSTSLTAQICSNAVLKSLTPFSILKASEADSIVQTIAKVFV
jgi:uncharacterized oligopeptide transporter (OPT) family protein